MAYTKIGSDKTNSARIFGTRCSAAPIQFDERLMNNDCENRTTLVEDLDESSVRCRVLLFMTHVIST